MATVTLPQTCPIPDRKKDNRDPQHIGEILLSRDKRIKITAAADQLSHIKIRNYGE